MSAPPKSSLAARFGLGGLNRALRDSANVNAPPEASSVDISQQSSSAAEPVYRYLGRLVARFLDSKPTKDADLFEVVEALRASIEELLPVAKWLEQKDVIEITARPLNGNWRLRLKESAADFVRQA